MSSPSEKSNSPAKPVKRRYKRPSQVCDINYAEVRRQIFHALQLHRSSRSSSSSHAVAGPQFKSLVESMPLPEPVWSTTAPSVLAHTPSSSSSAAAANMEALEFEWGENQASSYSWWISFLKTLDGNNAEKSKYPMPLESSNWLFGQNQNSNYKVGDQETSLVDANDHSPSPDEWLMFPTTEDEGENEIP